jgi:hypothetical protein
MRAFGLSAVIFLCGATMTLATVFGTVRGVVHDPKHRPMPGTNLTLTGALRHRRTSITVPALLTVIRQFPAIISSPTDIRSFNRKKYRRKRQPECAKHERRKPACSSGQ